MPTNSRKLLVFACILLAGGVSSASKEDSVSPESLIAQARKLHELWTEGTPPVTMRAELQVLNNKGTLAPGQYAVTWASLSRWREEVQFADYERLRVHDARGYWQKSSVNFKPETIFQLDTMLDFKSALRIPASQTLGKVRNRDKDGVRRRCTEVKWKTGTDRVLCFEEASGNLLSIEYPLSAQQNPPEISRIEYSAFSNVGKKRVPFEIRAFRDRKVVATVKVLEIKPVTEENPALFLRPANSEFWPQCDDMQPPELVDRVQPKYPASARSNFEQGRVINYAVIEADGAVSHLTLIQRATPALELAAADAIRQWRYKPAVCESTPVRVETSIATDFWLEH